MEGMREVRTGRKEDALHSRLKMCLCVCARAHTHTHTHVYVCARVCFCVCARARVRACVMRARAHTHAHTHVYMCARVCFCVRAMLLLPLSLLHFLPPSFSSSLVSANAAIQRDTRAMDEHLDTATVPRLFFRRNPPNRSPGPTTCPSPASAHVTTMRPCQAHWRGTTTHSCARIALHRRRVDLSAVSVARSSLLPRHAARALGTSPACPTGTKQCTCSAWVASPASPPVATSQRRSTLRTIPRALHGSVRRNVSSSPKSLRQRSAKG